VERVERVRGLEDARIRGSVRNAIGTHDGRHSQDHRGESGSPLEGLGISGNEARVGAGALRPLTLEAVPFVTERAMEYRGGR